MTKASERKSVKERLAEYRSPYEMSGESERADHAGKMVEGGGERSESEGEQSLDPASLGGLKAWLTDFKEELKAKMSRYQKELKETLGPLRQEVKELGARVEGAEETLDHHAATL